MTEEMIRRKRRKRRPKPRTRVKKLPKNLTLKMPVMTTKRPQWGKEKRLERGRVLARTKTLQRAKALQKKPRLQNKVLKCLKW